jgi:hypothetical protein
MIAYFLTYAPLVLILSAWIKLYYVRGQRWPRVLTLVTLGIVTANAVYCVGTVLYFEFRPPSRWLPPWKDPETRLLGELFLLAPPGMILGGIAAARGAPKWVIWMAEIASVLLFMVGLAEGMTV